MSYTYKYPRPAVTTDCVVFTKEEEPKVLLIQRGKRTLQGLLGFSGRFHEYGRNSRRMCGPGTERRNRTHRKPDPTDRCLLKGGP